MSGWLTNGLNNPGLFVGSERFPFDASTGLASAANLVQLAAAAAFFSNFASKTTVAGTRYYSSFVIGATPAPTAGDGGAVEAAPVATLTGLQVLVGATGGTDSWNAELHDANGVTLATSLLTGTTAGAAGTWQQLAFTATYAATPGLYFLVIQSNGTTAHPAVYNFPAPASATNVPIITGSATGTLGTAANFTPATTYTANLGPVMLPY